MYQLLHNGGLGSLHVIQGKLERYMTQALLRSNGNLFHASLLSLINMVIVTKIIDNIVKHYKAVYYMNTEEEFITAQSLKGDFKNFYCLFY